MLLVDAARGRCGFALQPTNFRSHCVKGISMNERRHVSLPALGIATLLSVGIAATASADRIPDRGQQGTLAIAATAIADANQHPSFPDRGQLGTQWWQLVFSIPGLQNPFLDTTGANCGIGQRGSTWFLYSSSLGPLVELDCTIPAGKTIFLAVNVGICVPFPGETIQENIKLCRDISDLTDSLILRVDGKARNDLIERRANFNVFALPVPDDAVFGFPAGVVVAVHDGFFATVPPLKPGRHTIRVKSTTTAIGFATDTLYHLHIVKPAKALPSFPET